VWLHQRWNIGKPPGDREAQGDNMTTMETYISWAARIIVAVILLQTLFFKFTGAEESKYIFTTLMGAEFEAVGRIGSGVVELVAAILLLIPSKAWLGSVVALGTISGAIFSHLTMLGIEVKGDGGLLFGLAVTVFVLSAIVLLIHRRELPIVGHAF
jgi:uncharacterized membrane protein YphA (DoxX/SURF4 family)